MLSESYLRFRRPRNGNDIFSLRQDPGKRYLARSSVVTFPDRFEAIYQFQDIWKVLFGVSRHNTPEISLFKVIGGALQQILG